MNLRTRKAPGEFERGGTGVGTNVEHDLGRPAENGSRRKPLIPTEVEDRLQLEGGGFEIILQLAVYELQA
ncbi:hypothetical protein RCO27_13445 [Sphingosinicella sp. LHD-64]|uniref:hypothetical protein n=1 Tax=Sphingosinicella sp. LHD-64 TaxID=3072139 RepID=UPI00280C5212|nr:hypothetical protein [Sphingosinicella sp. LHD-64]MDQ8757231.1 hypothetical protein [Sphingosinicella sp. LHD-64]